MLRFLLARIIEEEDDFDAYNHSEGGIFDNGLRNGDDDDDASVDFNRGAPEQEDDDQRVARNGGVPSPSAMVSPDRIRRKPFP